MTSPEGTELDDPAAMSKRLRILRLLSDTRSMRLRQRLSREDGFTLVEALVALVIIFGLMVVLLRTFDSSSRVLIETRRQSAANQFASELLERAQALEWEHMGLAVSRNGISCPDEQVGCYIDNPISDLAANTLTGGFDFGGEAVVFSNADTFAPFLDFHDRVERGGTEFDRYLIVSSMLNPVSGEESGRRITAIVQWVPPGGFRREVRLETIVSEFRAPSQPLIVGEIDYDSGFFALVDRDEVTNPGSDVGGTINWWFNNPGTGVAPIIDIELQEIGLGSRELVTSTVVFPSVEISAISDFVSGGRIVSTGTNVGALNWGGVSELANVPAPNIVFFAADDDATSVPPPNYNNPNDFELYNQSRRGYRYAPEDPKGITVFESESAAEGDLLHDAPSDPAVPWNEEPVVFDMNLWTFYDNTVLVLDGVLDETDGKPIARYAQKPANSPDSLRVGFTEYVSTGGNNSAHGFYNVFGIPLAETQYNFTLFNRNDGTNAIYFNGIVDRDDDAVLDRTVTAEADSTGAPVYLFHDDAYPVGKGNAGFQGWIKIEMPTMDVNNVVAGEGVVPAPVTNFGDIIISEWDPLLGPNGGYVEVINEPFGDYYAGSCSSAGTTAPLNVWFLGGAEGATIGDTIQTPGSPWLRYELSGSIVVRDWCTEIETDSLGNVSASLVTTNGYAVSGDINYNVKDVYWSTGSMVCAICGTSGTAYNPLLPWLDDTVVGEATLYDLRATFGIDDLRVSTIYEDPNA